MLGRSLNHLKWLALILLTGGVALVQMPSGGSSSKAHSENSDSFIGSFYNLFWSRFKFVGLACVLAACFSSGFAGVFFEKILKTSNVSLWTRNLQLGAFWSYFFSILYLAFFSIFGGFYMCWMYDWDAIEKDGFFQGYNNTIWIVVLLQVLILP